MRNNEDEYLDLDVRDMHWGGGIEIYGYCHHSNGKTYIANPVEVTEHEPNGLMPSNPTMRVSHHGMKMLMNKMWALGIRPTGVSDASQGARHLEDMRAIAFSKLNVEKPDG